jgi:hypothetical protein
MNDTTYIMPENMRTVLSIAKTLYIAHGAVWFDPWAFTSMTTMRWVEINHWIDDLVLFGYLDWRGKGEHAPERGVMITQEGLDYLEGKQ